MMRMFGMAMLAALAGGGLLAEGTRHARAGDWARAAAAYERAMAEGDTSALARYNRGTALLALGRHDEARPHLEAAARAGGASPLPFRAHYNAAAADLAPVAAGAVPDEARIPRLRRAVEHLRRALLLDPGDEDAKWNLELAQRLLDRASSSGGGGDDDEDGESGGGGGGGAQAPASPRPRPGPAGDAGPRPMTRDEAESLLAGAGRRESDVQRRQLRKDQARIPGVRDW